MPPDLHVDTRTARLSSSIPPYLPHRYTYIGLPVLQTSKPPCRYTCIEPPTRQNSVRLPSSQLRNAPLHPCRHTCIASLELQSSIPLSRDVYTPAARLQHSIPPYFRIATRAACLLRSIPSVLPHRYACSMPPALHTSIPLIPQIRNARPELHTSIPPYLHTSTSHHLHRASRALCLHFATPTARFQSSIPPTFHATRLQRAFKAKGTSILLCLCACRAPPTFLRASTSIRWQRGSRPPKLYTSILPSLHD